MYPSFNRNQFPTVKGRTSRVEGFGLRAQSEVDYLRKSNLAALERAGSLYAHYRKFTPEWNVGRGDFEGRCPQCYNPHLARSTDPDCPVCYGTGYEGGFAQPVVQWMQIQDKDEGWEVSPVGFVTVRKGKSISPFIPIIKQFDMIAKLQKKDNVWQTTERFFVDEPVTEKRVRDNFELLENDTDNHLDPQTEVFGFEFSCVYITNNNKDEFLHMAYEVPFENVIWLADPTKVEGIR